MNLGRSYLITTTVSLGVKYALSQKAAIEMQNIHHRFFEKDVKQYAWPYVTFMPLGFIASCRVGIILAIV